MPAPTLKVFISSTERDLQMYRKAAFQACRKLELRPVGMEDFPPDRRAPPEVCLSFVDQVDIYLGIYAHRYGFIPKGSTMSLTEMEYDRAVSRGIPVLLFVVDSDYRWSPRHVETGKSAKRLERFKAKVGQNHVFRKFRDLRNFREDVLVSLAKLALEGLAKKDESQGRFQEPPAPEPAPIQAKRVAKTKTKPALSALPPVVASRPARRNPEPGEEWSHGSEKTLLVYVPGGLYYLGANVGERGTDKDAQLIHRVILRPFWIGKYPVTNEQYALYLKVHPRTEPPPLWKNPKFNQPDQPVVGVTWHEAKAYCLWAGLALPSEAQWEAAARGAGMRRYPWGNDSPASKLANYAGKVKQTTPVNAYPAGTGPFGTLDQIGNVWEWCEDVWDPKAYWARDKQENPLNTTHGEPNKRCLRGGAWDHSCVVAAYRFYGLATDRRDTWGFRCVLPADPE
jgi:iron(II)-dependent oxidoreductase